MAEPVDGIVARGQDGHCPICRARLGRDVARCPRCDALYHPECWEYAGASCAMFGCEPDLEWRAAARAQRADERPLRAILDALWNRERRRPGRAGAALLALLITGFALPALVPLLWALPPVLVVPLAFWAITTFCLVEWRGSHETLRHSAVVAFLVTAAAALLMPLPLQFAVAVVGLAPAALIFRITHRYRVLPHAVMICALALLAPTHARWGVQGRDLGGVPMWPRGILPLQRQPIVLSGPDMAAAWHVGTFLDDISRRLDSSFIERNRRSPASQEPIENLMRPCDRCPPRLMRADQVTQQPFYGDGEFSDEADLSQNVRCVARFALANKWQVTDLGRTQLDQIVDEMGEGRFCAIREPPNAGTHIVLVRLGERPQERVYDILQSGDTVTIRIQVSTDRSEWAWLHRSPPEPEDGRTVQALEVDSSFEHLVVEYVGDHACVLGGPFSLWLDSYDVHSPAFARASCPAVSISHDELLDRLADQAAALKSRARLPGRRDLPGPAETLLGPSPSAHAR